LTTDLKKIMSQDPYQQQDQIHPPPYYPQEGASNVQDFPQQDQRRPSKPLVVLNHPQSRAYGGYHYPPQMIPQQGLVHNPAFMCPGNGGAPHDFSKEFTCCGILWGICCFPCGLACCFTMRKNVCIHCGKEI